jgi:hypothetical protein
MTPGRMLVLWYVVAALMTAWGLVAAPVLTAAGPSCSGCG